METANFGGQKRLCCKWSGFGMGSEIRKPNHLKSGPMASILSSCAINWLHIVFAEVNNITQIFLKSKQIYDSKIICKIEVATHLSSWVWLITTILDALAFPKTCYFIWIARPTSTAANLWTEQDRFSTAIFIKQHNLPFKYIVGSRGVLQLGLWVCFIH